MSSTHPRSPLRHGLLVGAFLLALAGSAKAGFQIEVGLPPDAPQPSELTGAAEKLALRGLKEVDAGFNKVRAVNLAEPYYQFKPLSKDAAAKRRIRALAEELGIDPKRVIVTAGDAPLIPHAGSAGDFVFFHEQLVLSAPEDILAFLLAHEWAHVTREHIRKLYRLYYWELVASCMSCVQEQRAKGVDAVQIAAAANHGPLKQTWAIVPRWLELEADLFAARLLKSKGRSLPVDEMFSYFLRELSGEAEESGEHPSFAERKVVIRLVDKSW